MAGESPTGTTGVANHLPGGNRKADQEVKPFCSADNDSAPTTIVSSDKPLPSSRSMCAAGDVLAGRYRIVRFIARGGMGEVYEAEDTELRERVALKTIRPEIASDEASIARFKREMQLARKVTHPNVDRSFDLGYHGRTGADAITFLTMELLEGETLSDRLKRTGRMDTTEALPLVEQMVAAMAAAHKVGIVHRDFKSANVMLVPSEDGTRAVVTDFGLARGPARGDSTATASGAILGTPDTMAPEQVEGGAITPATDIYSLGIVLYQMVTGALPFAGDSPLAIAIKRLKEAPSSPRVHVPDLDPRWEAVILRCLERNPGDRFQNVLDVLPALRGETIVKQRGSTTPPTRILRRYRLWSALAILVALTLAGGLYFHAARGRAGTRPGAPIKSRRAVAVLGFKNLSGRSDAQWLSTALSEMLTSELAAGEKLRTIPGENVARMKIDLSLPDTESLAKDTLSRIRTNLGTDFVVAGSYVALGKESGGQIRIDLVLQDAAAGETIASVEETGTESRLFDLVSEAGAGLREKLGVGTLASAETQGVQASLPSNPEAARLYSEGLAKLRFFDSLAARDLLEKAIAADPKHAMAHSALAEAWTNLGYDIKAKEEAKKAFDLSGNLSREEKLLIEGRYRKAVGELDKAMEIYKTLCIFFPDSIDHGLRLAYAQDQAGKSKDALATVENLRKIPMPDSDDPRIDLVETWIDNSLSDWNRALESANRVIVKGEQRGDRLIVYNAYLEQGWAYWRLGDFDKARAAFYSAKQGASESGDLFGVARALNLLGNSQGDQGDFDGAINMLEESLVELRKIGNKRRAASALNNIGVALWYEGRLAEARKAYDASMATAEEVGDKTQIRWYLNNVALVLTDQGNLTEATAMLEKALPISSGAGDKNNVAWHLYGLGHVFKLQGNTIEARMDLEKSLAIRNEIGMKGDAADTRRALASLCIDEGRPRDAIPLLTNAVDEFRSEKRGTDEGFAYVILARSFLAQGKTPEGQKAIADAAPLLENTQDFNKRISFLITANVINAASGNDATVREAVQNLNRVIVETTKAGFVGLQFEARLALGEIEMKSGQVDAGRARLAILAKEANAKGYLLMVRKAEALAAAKKG